MFYNLPKPHFSVQHHQVSSPRSARLERGGDPDARRQTGRGPRRQPGPPRRAAPAARLRQGGGGPRAHRVQVPLAVAGGPAAEAAGADPPPGGRCPGRQGDPAAVLAAGRRWPPRHRLRWVTRLRCLHLAMNIQLLVEARVWF